MVAVGNRANTQMGHDSLAPTDFENEEWGCHLLGASINNIKEGKVVRKKTQSELVDIK